MKCQKDSFKKLMETLEYLKEESEDKIIIVEGKKDIVSLNKLGVFGTFIPVRNIPIYLLCDELLEMGIKEVILMVDFDRRGKLLSKRIIDELSSRGIFVNTKIRNDILTYTHKEVKDIESLYNYISKRLEIYRV